MKNNNKRIYVWLCLITSAAAMTGAIIIEKQFALEPCHLCVLQRIAMGLVILTSFFALIHQTKQRGTRIYLSVVALFSLLGLGTAARHMWLQNLPADQVPECGPTLEYLLQTFPLSETLAAIFRGTGQCAETAWVFLRLSIPEWAAIAFGVITMIALFGLFHGRKKTL